LQSMWLISIRSSSIPRCTSAFFSVNNVGAGSAYSVGRGSQPFQELRFLIGFPLPSETARTHLFPSCAWKTSRLQSTVENAWS
jgi:hypothetical protein